MIKRASMWRLKDKSSVEKMKGELLSLLDNIPELLDMEVGINLSDSASAFDIVFIGTFLDHNAMKLFDEDPFHLSVNNVVSSFKLQRHVVEFEIS